MLRAPGGEQPRAPIGRASPEAHMNAISSPGALLRASPDFVFEGRPVRIIQDASGEPWFVAPDVCRVLEMAEVSSALRTLDPDEKGPLTVRTLGGDQMVAGISEPGLYKLMARSRKPEARRFDRWVRHEVLPAIRRDGSYTVALPDDSLEEICLRAMAGLQAAVARQKAELLAAAAQIEELEPKAEAHDQLAAARGSMGVRDAAKVLKVAQNRVGDSRRSVEGEGGAP